MIARTFHDPSTESIGCAVAALEVLEPLRVVTYDLPGVPVPIRACTRPTPEALAVASVLGGTAPRPATPHPRSLTQPHHVPTRCCDTISQV